MRTSQAGGVDRACVSNRSFILNIQLHLRSIRHVPERCPISLHPFHRGGGTESRHIQALNGACSPTHGDIITSHRLSVLPLTLSLTTTHAPA